MMQRRVYLDTETTGLSKDDRIIEIGCIEEVNGQLTGKKYQQYLNPQHAISKGAYNVHKISSDFLKDKPTFAEIAHDFMKFIEGAEVVIHNAPFDVRFINQEFSHAKLAWKSFEQHCKVTDSLALARKKLLVPGVGGSLDKLCQYYGVDNSNRQAHGALLDAELLAQVYPQLLAIAPAVREELPASKVANSVISSVPPAGWDRFMTLIADREPPPLDRPHAESDTIATRTRSQAVLFKPVVYPALCSQRKGPAMLSEGPAKPR